MNVTGSNSKENLKPVDMVLSLVPENISQSVLLLLSDYLGQTPAKIVCYCIQFNTSHLSFGVLSFILEKMRKKLVPLHAVSFPSPWIFRLKSLGLWVLLSLLFNCRDNHCTVLSNGMYVSEIVFEDIPQLCALRRGLV